MGAYDNCIVLIPALQPDERLIQMIHGLHERGFHKMLITKLIANTVFKLNCTHN